MNSEKAMHGSISTLSSNGQTTIPLEIRKLLGLEPSQKILYRVENGKVVMEAAGAPTEALYGSLSSTAKMEGDEEVARANYAKEKYGVKSDA